MMHACGWRAVSNMHACMRVSEAATKILLAHTHAQIDAQFTNCHERENLPLGLTSEGDIDRRGVRALGGTIYSHCSFIGSAL